MGGFVDEDERGLLADADAVEEFAFESGLLDEPAGVNFGTIFAAMYGIVFVFGDFGGAFV